jgi:NAD(P)-dependent dehydrogenase (short-subunit alcohol dehydrogenase family)
MGKVIFISGISSGFGKEISCQLVKSGHIVYGTIRSDCDVAEGVHVLKMELTQPETIKAAIDEVIAKEGRIDVVINNAGMHSGGSIEETTEDVFHLQMDTNYFGLVYVVRNVLPYMRKQKSGTIINFSSIGGLIGLPFQGFHSSTKFAIEGFSQALRMELRNFNVNVVVINPGDFNTQNTKSRIKSMSKGGPYEKQFLKTLSIIEKDETGGLNPKIMAGKICRVVDCKNPRRRYVVASFKQKMSVVMLRLFPEWLLYRLLGWYYGIK